MSAIGDYVHWSYAGYVERKGAQKEPYFIQYASALMNRENHFYQWVQKQENKAIKDLERETQKSLNLLKSFKENKGNISQVQNNKMAMALLNDLWSELDTKYLTIDKIAAMANGLIDGSGYGSGTNIGNRTFRQQASTGNINAQIENLLNNTLTNINNSISAVLTDKELSLSDIKQATEKTQQNINQMIAKLNAKGQILTSGGKGETKTYINQMFQELIQAIQSNDKLNSSIDILGILNTIALGLSAGTTANQYKGDISEALISVIGKKMAGTALNAVDTTIQSAAVSGQERSSRGINTMNFVSDVDWYKTLNKDRYTQPFGEFIVSAAAVQDKVDVKIELSDGSHAYISVKNYSPKNLSSGVRNKSASFLSLIQNENQNNFINHYLNLNAVTGAKGTLKTNAAEVNDLIRKIIVAKLITGYNTVTGQNQTMDEANIFAVFNSESYTVKYYNMKDVLGGVFNSGRYKTMFIPQYFYKSNLRTTDYSRRISNVLKQLDVRVAYTLHEEEYAKK